MKGDTPYEYKFDVGFCRKCLQCQDGLYLLKNQTGVNSSLYPNYLSFCVPDCQLAGYQYVNNPVTGKCQSCGNHCKSCNINYGCETCIPEGQSQGWVNAIEQSISSGFYKCQVIVVLRISLRFTWIIVCKHHFKIHLFAQFVMMHFIQTSLAIVANVKLKIAETVIPLNQLVKSANKATHYTIINAMLIQTVKVVPMDLSFRITVYLSALQGTMDTKICHDNCKECVGELETECIRCPYETYLSKSDIKVSFGECITKPYSTFQVNIYVAAPSSKDFQSQDSDGSILNPFYDIRDALIKMYEDCADVQEKCYSYCLTTGDKVIIKNKIRDRLNIKVGQGLTITNVIIDSLDSIVDTSETASCLSDILDCCQIDSLTNLIKDKIIGNSICQPANQRLTEECNIASGGYFIKFDISSNTVLNSPPTLIINNCEFKNFIFNFNSLIETNPNGGHINITNSIFDRFTSCGAIIRNFRREYVPYYEDADQLYRNHWYRQNNIVADIYERIYFEENNLGTYCTSNCESLIINSTTFSNFGRDFTKIDTIVDINPALGLHKQARIVNLNNFRGLVKIENSIFEGNILGYNGGCSIHYQDQSYKNKKDNDDYFVYYWSNNQYWSNYIQLKSLITIEYQQGSIQILNNIFKGNSVIKGLIYIDGDYITPNYLEQDIMIQGNQFNQNFAYLSTLAIYIRRYDPNFEDHDIINSNYIPCSGIIINENHFEKNFGCPLYGGGLITIDCQQESYYDELDNSYPLDVNNRYTPDGILELKNTHITLDDGIQDLKKIELSDNFYQQNFASYDEGLITLRGILLVYMQNETFNSNGENVMETFQNQFQELVSSQKPTYYNMQGLILAAYCLYLKIDGAFVSDNFLFEYDVNINKGSFITMDHFEGIIEINNSQIYNFYSFLRNLFIYEQGYDVGEINLDQTTPIIGANKESKMVGFYMHNTVLDTFYFTLYNHQQIGFIFFGGFCYKYHSYFSLKAEIVYLSNIHAKDINNGQDFFTYIDEEDFNGQMFQLDISDSSDSQFILSNSTFDSVDGNSAGIIPNLLQKIVHLKKLYLSPMDWMKFVIRNSQVIQRGNSSMSYEFDTYYVEELSYESNYQASGQRNYGSAISINTLDNQLEVYSENNHYEGCRFAQQGGVFYIVSDNKVTFTETNSTYLNIQGIIGGVIYCLNCNKFELNDANFQYIQSYQGGLFYFIQSSIIGLDIIIKTTETSDLIAFDNGGMLLFNGNQSLISIYVEESNFTNIQSVTIDSTIFSALKCRFEDILSLRYGGIILIGSQNRADISFVQSTIFNVKANFGGSIIYSRNKNGRINLILEKNNVQCLEDPYDLTGEMQDFFENQNEEKSYRHAIQCYAMLQSTLNSNENTFKNCAQKLQKVWNLDQEYKWTITSGGVYNLQTQSSFVVKDKYSLYENNSAEQGSIYYCQNCDLTISNNVYLNNYCFEGCIVYSNMFQLVTDIKSSRFEDNLALFQGAIILQHHNIKFQGGQDIYIEDCEFTTDMEKYWYFQPYQSYSNQEVTSGLLFDIKQIITFVIKDRNLEQISFSDNTAQYGGALQLLDESEIQIDSSYFEYNWAYYDAGVILQKRYIPTYKKSSKLQIQDCEFYYNHANEDGGVLKLDEKYLDLTIEYSTFELSSADSGGNLKQAYSESNKYSKCYDAYSGGVINLFNSYFDEDGSTYESNDGGVISIDNKGKLNATGCSFLDNQAVQKGGVINLVTKSHFYISDSKFISNIAVENSILNVLESDEHNNAIENSKNIFVGFSNLTIINTKFLDSARFITQYHWFKV
ncbi:UNKNOWN [Stylonychia lemnae]|uniref:Uncharacterized protein n=1 Tax=Stylonychia lemnae TaxID=5949 RepID=A0A077ZN63_STYLE|nr:UNKNOWN [Stylonychia lemnae]|eukprot:CDW71358.1 UNKNOWN [Stylonychia lemnae]